MLQDRFLFRSTFFYTKEFEVRKKRVPQNHADLASLYNKIGITYFKLGDHPEALLFYKIELEIREKLLSQNQLHLANLYGDIHLVYRKIDEYRQSHSPYNKKLENREDSPHRNHSHSHSLYHKIAIVYFRIYDYQNAISFCEAAVEIGRELLAPNSHQLQMYERNLKNLKTENFEQCFVD